MQHLSAKDLRREYWSLLWPDLLPLALPLHDFTLLMSFFLFRLDMSFEPFLGKQERRFEIHVYFFALVNAVLRIFRLATAVSA